MGGGLDRMCSSAVRDSAVNRTLATSACEPIHTHTHTLPFDLSYLSLGGSALGLVHVLFQCIS